MSTGNAAKKAWNGAARRNHSETRVQLEIFRNDLAMRKDLVRDY
jgi:hypothetical protein